MLRRSLLAGALLFALTGAARADYAAGQIDYDAGLYADAYRELEPAAEGGDARSQYLLGRLYAEGRGVSLDFTRAYMWFDLAAESDYPPAITARDALASRGTRSQLARARALADAWRAAHGVPAGTPPATGAAGQPAPSVGVPFAEGPISIPPGHMPPPGECRIWFPDRPPGQQPPPGPCRWLQHQIPPGAYLIRG
jgi:hypothetical protein